MCHGCFTSFWAIARFGRGMKNWALAGGMGCFWRVLRYVESLRSADVGDDDP